MSPIAKRPIIVLLVLAAACSPAPSTKGMVSEEALAIAVKKATDLEESFVAERKNLQATIEQLRSENAALRDRLGERAVSTEAAARAAAEASSAPPKPANAVDLVSMAVKPIGSMGSSTTYSWVATVRNNTALPREVLVTINFLDADGFKLDYGNERVYLGPGEQKDVSNTTYVKNELAARVAKFSGKLD